MKHVVRTLVAMYVTAALVGKVLEAAGVTRCDCSAGCWCRKSGLSAFRWVLPYRHR